MPYTLEHVKKQQVPAGDDAMMIQHYNCDRWYYHICAGGEDKAVVQSKRIFGYMIFKEFEAEFFNLLILLIFNHVAS